MKLKLKTVFLLITLVFIVSLAIIILSFLFESNRKEKSILIGVNQNILEDMKDGLRNDEIKQVYANDIEDVYKLTEAKHIEIRYVDFDLNEDGYLDKIVIIQSPLRSGSGGDSFDILINNGEDVYIKLSGLVFRLLTQAPEYSLGNVCILEDMTNGYHNIGIATEGKEIVLKWGAEGIENSGYAVSRQDGGTQGDGLR